jgi:hypothetical protein
MFFLFSRFGSAIITKLRIAITKFAGAIIT